MPREKCARIHASSGTDGQAHGGGLHLGAISHLAGVVARSIRARVRGRATWCACELQLRPVHSSLEAPGAETAPTTETRGALRRLDQTEQQVSLGFPARHHRSHAGLHCSPSPTRVERQGIDPRSLSLRIGIFGAGPWTNDVPPSEERIGIDAVDIYGLSGCSSPSVASECGKTRAARPSGKTKAPQDHQPLRATLPMVPLEGMDALRAA